MSSTLFNMYKELLPPSTVEVCVEARFLSPNVVNLVVSKASLLQIYNLVQDPIVEDNAVQVKNEDENYENEDELNVLRPAASRNDTMPTVSKSTQKVVRLELVYQEKLHGVITSMGVIRSATGVGAMGMDSLLLSFKDAKMSLIEWSLESHCLETVSIHFYERDEYKKEVNISAWWTPFIRVDPASRCAALSFYHDQLAILPFKQDLGTAVGGLTTSGAEKDGASRYPFLPSFVIPVNSIDSRIKHVIDMAFLYDYFEPALAILYQTQQTWTGRVAAVKDNTSLLIVSLSVSNKANTNRTYPVLYQSDNLPYNCNKLVPCPSPVGGVLVLSPNALIHVDSASVPGVACAFNGYYGIEHDLPEIVPPPTDLEIKAPVVERKELKVDHRDPLPKIGEKNPIYGRNLTDYRTLGKNIENAIPFFLNPDTILLVLRDGEMMIVELVGSEDVGRGWNRRKSGVKKFKVTPTCLRSCSPIVGCRLALHDVSSLNRQLVSGRVSNLLKRKRAGDFGDDNDGDDISNGYLFIGSRVSDSMLIQFLEVDDETKEDEEKVDIKVDSTEGEIIATGDVGSQDAIDQVEDEDEDDLYQSTAEPSQKKVKVELSTNVAEEAIDSDDEDLYGPSEPSMKGDVANKSTKSLTRTKTKKTYKFRIVDSLLNTGPIRDFTIGRPHEFSETPFEPEVPHPDIEIVACTGEDQDGSLCVVSPSVKPLILSSFEMGKTKNMWAVAVCGADGASSEDKLASIRKHKFLVLSQEDASIVLETGDELQQIENPEFFTTGATVAVGTALRDSVIVQVHKVGVLLLDGEGKRINEFSLVSEDGDERWVVAASIVDPYALLQLNTGEMMLLVVDESDRNFHILHEMTDVSVQTCCLYADTAAKPYLLTNRQLREAFPKIVSKKSIVKPESNVNGSVAVAMDVDDDADLYGDDDNADGLNIIQGRSLDAPDVAVKIENEDAPMGDAAIGGNVFDGKIMYCLCVREDGSFEVLSVPDMRPVYFVPQIGLCPRVLSDQMTSISSTIEDQAQFEEIVMVNMGCGAERRDNYLLLRTSKNDLHIYKAFMCPSSSIVDLAADRIGMRFVRMPHEHISRVFQPETDSQDNVAQTLEELMEEDTAQQKKRKIRQQYFKQFRYLGNLTGRMYEGVFMGGQRPCWIMFGKTSDDAPPNSGLHLSLDIIGQGGEKFLEKPVPVKGGLRFVRVHPMAVDGQVLCFTEFHNINCPNGFLYMNDKNNLRICQLPIHTQYDHDWPTNKISLHRTPHKIVYHEPSQTYVLITSVKTKYLLPRAQHLAAITAVVLEDDEPFPDTSEREQAAVETGKYLPDTRVYRAELISPVTWETVDTVEVDEMDFITAAAAVSLQTKETASGRKTYISLGTSYIRGEDLASRGKLYILDIIEVVPEIDNPQTNHKFKHIHKTEVKGPVSAICDVNGYLAASIGQKIIVYEFEKSEKIDGVAFIDTNVMVVSLSAIKGMLLASDVSKSIWFLGFQQQPPKLVILGKDFQPMACYSSEYLVDGNRLGMVVTDAEKNMHVFNYAPYNIQSLSGQKLIKSGDIHTGSHISKLVRIRKLGDDESQSQFLLFGTLDGGMGALTPVSEKLYKRLHLLHTRLVNGLRHAAGLNPRGYRLIHNRHRLLVNPSKNVVDGEIVFSFLNLPKEMQEDIARGIGCTVDSIYNDLSVLMGQMDYF